uniref:Uncharacterized protein n=1 Tax=Rhodopseudomonas palustris (strain BisA53) TaxID=316055 RepID=Q07H75_RHOP5
MAASHSHQSPDHSHARSDHAGHVHLHAHGAESPHPSQPLHWSILRMTLWGRLAVALALSLGLWAAVLTAMR